MKDFNMSSSQRRCVFVGNIPYEATQDQLIRIFEEVGPVVSFRLVVDRDTGRGKGYGFCEFRDEETALSARRNLQGYEINGRQLRVDFAENSTERQVRVGSAVHHSTLQPIMNPQFTDVSRQVSHAHSQLLTKEVSLEEPMNVGAAASVTGVLDTSSISISESQGNVGGDSQPNANLVNGMAIGTDALADHLASMSKHQLYQIVYQVKDLIQQNQKQAREILIANPQLTKALFRAQIMLGMVKPSEPALPQDASLQQPPAQQTQLQLQLSQSLNTLQMPVKQESSQAVQAEESMVQSRPHVSSAPVQHSQPGPSASVLTQHQQYVSSTQQQQHPQPAIPQNVAVLSHSQPVALPALQPSMQHSQSLPPPPPLPQQPRPLVSSAQLQPQTRQEGHSAPQDFLSQPSVPQQVLQQGLQHQGGMMQVNVGYPIQQMHPPGQPPMQHIYQMPRIGGDASSVPVGQGPIIGMGKVPLLGTLAASAPVTWNQPSGTMAPGAPLQHMDMMAGHHGASNVVSSILPGGHLAPGPIQQGPGLVYSQGYNQQLLHLPPQQQPQIPIELEQQKALLQQVMNLTAEQINLLQPEQRQQVFQLQQAFRGQIT